MAKKIMKYKKTPPGMKKKKTSLGKKVGGRPRAAISKRAQALKDLGLD